MSEWTSRLGGWFYSLGRRLGRLSVAWVAFWVATGYFLFLVRRTRTSFRFYRILFPHTSWFQVLALVWRQYHNFADGFVERLALDKDRIVEISLGHWDRLKKIAEEKTGAILVMSHVGNWEVAARLLGRKGLEMLLFMGARPEEQVEKIQKIELSRDAVRSVVQTPGQGTWFDGLTGLGLLRQGGFVSLSGDRSSSNNARKIEVTFLGRRVHLPRTPYAFAKAASVPLFFFFCFKIKRHTFRFWISQPKYVQANLPGEKEKAIQAVAQDYSEVLEKMVREYPTQWYHFNDELVLELVQHPRQDSTSWPESATKPNF